MLSNHQADENIRSIEHAAQLADAVQANMLAAVSEFEPQHQKKYLKVERAWCEFVAPTRF